MATQSDRLHAYLRTLSPAIKAALLSEVEQKRLVDERVSGDDLVLAELRSDVRESQAAAERVGNPGRTFFEPIESLLIDDAAESAREKIARTSLTPIWVWICRDLIPDAAKCYSKAAKRAILENDNSSLAELAEHFRQRVCEIARKELSSPAGRRRICEQLGGFGASERISADLNTMLKVFSNTSS